MSKCIQDRKVIKVYIISIIIINLIVAKIELLNYCMPSNEDSHMGTRRQEDFWLGTVCPVLVS